MNYGQLGVISGRPNRGRLRFLLKAQHSGSYAVRKGFRGCATGTIQTEIGEKIAVLNRGICSYGLHPRRGTKSRNTVSCGIGRLCASRSYVMCRVIDAFVEMLVMSELGFERSQAAETGRPGYDPRDLLKLYLYGYLNQIRSSRRLEAECRRNIELMWLLAQLSPSMAYNIKRITNVLGATKLTEALHHA